MKVFVVHFSDPDGWSSAYFADRAKAVAFRDDRLTGGAASVLTTDDIPDALVGLVNK